MMSSSFESSVSKSLEPKHKMKAVVNAIQKYLDTQQEEHLMTLNTHLQHLSSVKEVGIFEPHAAETTQFLNSIYELMCSDMCKNVLPWNCINVLSRVCRNSACREVLIRSYQFIPVLCRLLDVQLPLDKKEKLLKLMEDLTCGIRIVFHMPKLDVLMITLYKWTHDQEGSIAISSLIILSNLCYKNVTAVHTLMANVDVKALLKHCILSEHPIAMVHTYKLMLSMENFYGSSTDFFFSQFMRAIFLSIDDAITTKDLVSLRLIIDFFSDVCQESNLNMIHNDNCFYTWSMTFLEHLENNNFKEPNDDCNDTNQCLSYILKFFNSLILLKLPTVIKTYPNLIPQLINSINNDAIACEALNTLKSTILTITPETETFLKPLKNQIKVIIDKLNWTDHPIYDTNRNKVVAAALGLLRTMLNIVPLRDVIFHNLHVDTVEKLLGNCVYGENKIGTVNELDLSNMEILNVQVHGMALVYSFAKSDKGFWTGLAQKLLKNKQTHIILARCLQNGTKAMKKLALEVIGLDECFPEIISEALTTLQPVTSYEHMDQLTGNSQSQISSSQTLSPHQSNEVDEMISKIRNAFSQNFNIATSDVMNLYELRLASLTKAEKDASAAADTSSELCIQWKHRCSQLTVDIQNLQKALVATQKSNETLLHMKEQLCEHQEQLKEQLQKIKRTVANHEKTLSVREKEINDWRGENEALKMQRAEMEQLLQRHVDDKAQLQKMLENAEAVTSKMRKRCQQREESLKQQQEQIDSISFVKTRLEAELQSKDEKLDKLTSELHMKCQILDTITKYATSQHPEQSI